MLNIAILGTGIGKQIYLPIFLAHPHFNVVSVFSRDNKQARDVAKQFNIAEYTTDWKSLLANPRIDAVVIATPTYLHYEMCREAILNKKHVFLAAPATLSVAEAEELAALAKLHDVLVVVDHLKTYYPSRKFAQRLLSEGIVGSIHSIERTLRNQDLLNQHDNNKIWKWNYKSGGGAFMMAVANDLDFILRVAGGVSSVQLVKDQFIKTLADSHGDNIEVKSEDSFRLSMKMHSGTNVFLSVNMANPGKHLDEFVIYGEKGALVLSNNTDIFFFDKKNHKKERLAIPPSFQIHSVPGGIPYKSSYFLVDLFSSTIYNKTTISPTIEEAVHIMRIISSALNSYESGRVEILGSESSIVKAADTVSKGMVSKIGL